MFGRTSLFGAVIVGTTVVPYLMSSSSGVRDWAMKMAPSATADAPVETPPPTTITDSKGQQHQTTVVRPGDVPTHPLEEALQFNVTTSWIVAEWPRISADLAELDLHGYRVPLISGTTDADVAGSLTYYFDAKQNVARITLFGTTGDPRVLINLLESRFGMKRSATKEPNLYLYQAKSWTRKVTSELRIRPAKVLRNDSPHSRYEVALLLERP